MYFSNPYFVFSTPSNSLVDGIITCFIGFSFLSNTFEHFVENNLMSYEEETITMTSIIMFQN